MKLARRVFQAAIGCAQAYPGSFTVPPQQACAGSFTTQPQYSSASYPGAMPAVYGYGGQPNGLAPGAGYGGPRPGQISQDGTCAVM